MRAWRKTVRAPRRGGGHRRARRAGSRSRAPTTRSASGCGATRACPTTRGRRSSSRASCCRSCRCRRRATGATGAARELRRRRDAAAGPGRRGRRSSSRATSRRSDRRAGATSRRGPASRSATSREALARLETVSYRDERDTELLDLPGQPLPPASTPLPVRFLARWDQALLAYADRERIIPPGVAAAEAHALGRSDGDRRRPRRRELEARALGEGREGRHRAAPRDPPLGARRDPRRGGAHRAVLRARRAARRGRPTPRSSRCAS